jgi:hypothetical protein
LVLLLGCLTLFSLAGCEEELREIPTKIKFTDYRSNTGKSIASDIDRSIAGGITQTVIDNGSFAPYTALYREAKIGKKVASYTPSDFYVRINDLLIFGNHELYGPIIEGTRVYEGLADGWQIINLNKPIVLSGLEIKPGSYEVLEFWFRASITPGHEAAENAPRATFTRDGEQVTVFLDSLFPFQLTEIIFGGNTTRMTNQIVDIRDVVPSFDYDWAFFTGNVTYIAAWDGLKIPEDASAVSFEIRWDLKDIIERYDNKTPGDPTDDRFVLRNGFWEGFSLSARTE